MKFRARSRVFASILLQLITGIYGLKLKKLVVPEYVYWNKQAELECQYVLQNEEKLYTVQWYKDNDEFYRFEKSGARQVTWTIDNINVDKSQSNEKRLVLKNVSLMMRGMYKCEVSAETPTRSFVTTMGEAKMEVIALPKEGPRINGEQKSYQIGDTINLTCTSGTSYPAAKLKWFVNGNEIQTDSEKSDPTDRDQLLVSRSRVSFIAGPEHFIDGHIQIRCQATILGNHSVISLPVHHNNAAPHSSSKIGYQKDALISVRGSSSQIISNFIVNSVSLLVCSIIYDIT